MLTENAENFIKSKLLEYRSELENIINGGDISQYNYCERTHDDIDDEVYDKNYENRLRIAHALWYMSDGLDVEFITITLMNEEIKYLEKSVYGGTSRTAYLLLMKLSEYGKYSYKRLLKRVRNANMDCFCEFDANTLKKFSNFGKDWRKDDWDYIFELINDERSLEKFKNLENSEE